MNRKFVEKTVATAADGGLVPALIEIGDYANSEAEAQGLTHQVIAGTIEQGIFNDFDRGVRHDIVLALAKNRRRKSRAKGQFLISRHRF